VLLKLQTGTWWLDRNGGGFLGGEAKDGNACYCGSDGTNNPSVDGSLGFLHQASSTGVDEFLAKVELDDWGQRVPHDDDTRRGFALIVAVSVGDVVGDEVLAGVRVDGGRNAFVGEVVLLVVGAAEFLFAKFASSRLGDELGIAEADEFTTLFGGLDVSETNLADLLGNSVHVTPSFEGAELVARVRRDPVSAGCGFGVGALDFMARLCRLEGLVEVHTGTIAPNGSGKVAIKGVARGGTSILVWESSLDVDDLLAEHLDLGARSVLDGDSTGERNGGIATDVHALVRECVCTSHTKVDGVTRNLDKVVEVAVLGITTGGTRIGPFLLGRGLSDDLVEANELEDGLLFVRNSNLSLDSSLVASTISAGVLKFVDASSVDVHAAFGGLLDVTLATRVGSSETGVNPRSSSGLFVVRIANDSTLWLLRVTNFHGAFAVALVLAEVGGSVVDLVVANLVGVNFGSSGRYCENTIHGIDSTCTGILVGGTTLDLHRRETVQVHGTLVGVTNNDFLDDSVNIVLGTRAVDTSIIVGGNSYCERTERARVQECARNSEGFLFAKDLLSLGHGVLEGLDGSVNIVVSSGATTKLPAAGSLDKFVALTAKCNSGLGFIVEDESENNLLGMVTRSISGIVLEQVGGTLIE